MNTPGALADGKFNQEWPGRHHAFHRALLWVRYPDLEAVAAGLGDYAQLYRRWYRALTDDGDRDLATEYGLLKELMLGREIDTAPALLRTHIEGAPFKLIAYAEHESPPPAD